MKLKTKQKQATVEGIDAPSQIESKKSGTASMPISDLVDQLGAWTEQEEKLNAVLQGQPAFIQLKALQSAISDAEKKVMERVSKGLLGDKTKTVEGGLFVAEVGKAALMTTVPDNLAVATALDSTEDGLAIKVAKFGVTDLKKHLTGAQQDALLLTERTGRRKLKVERIGQPF